MPVVYWEELVKTPGRSRAGGLGRNTLVSYQQE